MSLLRWLVLVLAYAAALRCRGVDFALRDGDRVVFLGDSITEQRLYTTYVEAYALTRYPAWRLSFRNVGWGGDTSWLRQRAHPDEGQLFAAEGPTLDAMVEKSVGRGLGRDVLPLKPTFVTVKFGMNDHSYQAFRPDIFRAYSRSQSEIAKVLKGAGARVAFLTPQPIEDKRPDPDNDARNLSLRQFSDGLKEVADRSEAAFVDQFAPYMNLMLAARAHDPKAVIGGGDAVHPGPAGQTIMAWSVLKGLGATPAVSKADIQIPTKGANTESCRIDNLSVTEHGLAFDRLDDALPMPIDARAEGALKLAPILDELSRYGLRVTGLPEGTYEVSVDGESIARLDSSQLAQGINLSQFGGPVTQQAREVLALVFRKNDRYFDRWRNVQLYSPPGWAKGPEIETRREAELKRIDDEIRELESQIDAKRKPRQRHFEIKRVVS
ncbi:MAG: SGNH/GDSL hydrolase family protein [Verrucomicrobiales bacterium]|nr:SGNH/GDSL hydrolase family protein [Verrucomicrobiales bacterium]